MVITLDLRQMEFLHECSSLLENDDGEMDFY